MWKKGNKISFEELSQHNSFYVSFNCGLCSVENILYFSDYSNDFFIKNPEYVWEHILGCPNCDKSNYHKIRISSKNTEVLINIESEFVDPSFQNQVDIDSIHYSFTHENESVCIMELPLEFNLIDKIIGNDFLGNFKKSIEEIQEVLKTQEVINNSTLRKLIYSNIISILETYLFDLIVNIVFQNKKYQRKIVENYGIFEKERIDKKDIYIAYDCLEKEILNKLQGFVYHNLEKVIPLYVNTLGINISSVIAKLPKSINIRHDIVHRNGKDFAGNVHEISILIIEELISNVNEVVTFIDNEIEKQGITHG